MANNSNSNNNIDNNDNDDRDALYSLIDLHFKNEPTFYEK